jgi:hypothetical protein
MRCIGLEAADAYTSLAYRQRRRYHDGIEAGQLRFQVGTVDYRIFDTV